MQSLQKLVDDMNLAGFVNIDRYVAGLDTRLEAAFLKRLLAVSTCDRPLLNQEWIR